MRNYYDSIPPQQHYTGDVWSGIPSYGLLSSSVINAVVITAACDLANRKVETVTLLPIISVRSYLSSSPSIRMMASTVKQAGKALFSDFLLWPDVDLLPSPEWVHIVSEKLLALNSSDDKLSPKIARLRSGLNVLTSLLNDIQVEFSDVKLLYGKEYDRQLDQILRNHPEKPDTYFFPADPVGTSPCIDVPSVALLRYPITIPVRILDYANDTRNLPDWNRAISTEMARISAAQYFSEIRPLKFSRITKLVMLDVITRHTMLQLRVGLPNYSTGKLKRITAQI